MSPRLLLAFVGSLALSGRAAAQSEPIGQVAAAMPPGQPMPLAADVQALYGEWRPVDPPPEARDAFLTIWGPMYSWGRGCRVSQGQLRDLGSGRFALEPGGGTPVGCDDVLPLAPFDRAEVIITLQGPNTMQVDRGGESWTFEKVDVAATVPRHDFIFGEWLLADTRGRPFRGQELTRVTFGDRGYSVDAANCDFWSNGWFPDRDGQIRAGGNQYTETRGCRPRMLGDRLALAGDSANLVAEPIETRITVRIGNQRATLVPAARFPELAPDADAIEPHPWAVQLAEAVARMQPEQRGGVALRAIGIGGEGQPGIEQPADARALAFAGLTAWQYAQAQSAGLIPAPSGTSRTLAENFAIAPIVVRAVLEGIRPVDRGDDLSLDYLYRVREGWRGGRQSGDLLIVRMPTLEGKSRSPVITPEPGEEVLLLASRTGYLAGRLADGAPPSFDTRVVQMTLPLMRIEDGRLAEAVAGANVLGSASFDDTSVEEARALAISVGNRMAELAPPRPSDNFGNPTVRRYFITRIGDRELTDPTRLWIEYDGSTNFGNPNGYGGVTAYFDGCTPVSRQPHLGNDLWATQPVACPGNQPDGTPITEPAVAEAVRWINENNFPDVICVSTCPINPDYTVPLRGGDIILKPMLR